MARNIILCNEIIRDMKLNFTMGLYYRFYKNALSRAATDDFSNFFESKNVLSEVCVQRNLKIIKRIQKIILLKKIKS